MSETLLSREAACKPGWLAALQDGLAKGQAQVLVTVAQAKGSTPRDAGARLWVNSAGAHDTIGGGHLELQAIRLATQMLAEGRPRRQTIRYPLGPRLGQCCGGVVWLAFEYLDSRDLAWCEALAQVLESGATATRRLVVPLDGVEAAASVEQDKVVVQQLDEASGNPLQGVVSGMPAADGQTAYWDEASGVLTDIISKPTLQVVVCGAGHVGRAIVRLLGELPVRVVWLDPRDDWWPGVIPDNVSCLQGDADDVPDCPDNAYWLVLTHSHALDMEIIEQVFRHKPFRFLGLIGSATKKARFISRLRQRFDADLVARMQCPIGLVATSSKLPSVIAVSVVAQLLPLLDKPSNPL